MYNEPCKAEIHCEGVVYPVLVNKFRNLDNNGYNYQVTNSFGLKKGFLSYETIPYEEKDMSVTVIAKANDTVLLGCDSRFIDADGNILQHNRGKRYFVDRSRGVAAVFSGRHFFTDCSNRSLETIDFIKKVVELSDGRAESLQRVYKDLNCSKYKFNDVKIHMYLGKDKYLACISYMNSPMPIFYDLGETDNFFNVSGSGILKPDYLTGVLGFEFRFADIKESESFIRRYFETVEQFYSTVKSKLIQNFVSPIAAPYHVISIDENGKILIDGNTEPC